MGDLPTNEFLQDLLSDKYPGSLKINKIYPLLSRIPEANETHKIGKEKGQGAMLVSKCLIQMTVVPGIRGQWGLKGKASWRGCHSQ